uniref:Vitellogenin-like n=1 Tax=Cimex lectularius TaxID=79782 RepID=A0A0U5BZ48_CIMLE|nr:vitellogenin-like [Cimex lectularius]
MKWLYVLGFVISINLGDGSFVPDYTSKFAKNEGSTNSGRPKIPETEGFLPPSPSFENDHKPDITSFFFFDTIEGNSLPEGEKISSVIDLTKQIASEIAKPNAITGMKTLSKFNAATRIIRTLSYKQLKLISRRLFENEAKPYETHFLLWSVFRDAVSQAGTRHAFLVISDWIMERRLVGEEAAEILSVIPNSIAVPTMEYMNDFFNLAKSEVVTSQKYLNVSAILSFTSLVRNSMSNEISPEGIPGNSSSTDKVIVEKYLPYLASQLKDAAIKRDSTNIQLYIRALGNTGHKEIFNIFEQYLQGKHSLSDFQRLTIISSLDKISEIYPTLTRTLLYNIYHNTGETQEIRVAAVIQIMKANPPAEILQRMAEFTNYEPNNQVASIVKSAIEEAARLNTPWTQKLAENAKSALNLLTTREFGIQCSKSFIRSFLSEKYDTEYHADVSYIQQRDSVIPSSLFYNHKINMGGLKTKDFQIKFMSSSSDDLLNFILDHIAKYPQKSHSPPKEKDTKWSWDKVANAINFKLNQAKDVEGNLLIDTLGGGRFFPFDNNSIKNIQDELKRSTYSFREGKKFNFTKLYNQREVQLSFPTATGLLFYFSFSEPTLFQLNGQIMGKAHPDFSFGEKNEILMPVSINASLEIDYLYSSKIDGKLGFVVPFNHQAYISGVEKNIFTRLPVYSHLDIDFQQTTIATKFRPLEFIDKNKMFECSSNAYTEVHDMRSWSFDDLQILQIMKTHNFKQTFGSKAIGFTVDLQMEGQHEAFDLGKLFSTVKRNNGLLNLLYPSYEDAIDNHNLTLSINSKMVKTKFAKLLLTYSTKMKVNDGKKKSEKEKKSYTENGKFELPTERSQRFEQLHKKASDGITEGQSTIIDAELSFDEYCNYVATGAYSSSPVSEDSRFMMWLHKFSSKGVNQMKPFQVSLQIDSKMPKVALSNYEQALNSDPTSFVNAWLSYGQDEEFAEISTRGILKRSTKRLEFLKNHAVSKACVKNTKVGNNIQPVCRNVTNNANILDQYEFDVMHKNVPECCKNMAYKAYSLARHLAYPKISENNLYTSKEKINFGISFAPNLKHLDFSIETPDFSTNFQNIEVGQMLIPLVVSHPEYSRIERFTQKLLPSAVCSVDERMMTTFDNRQFHYKMGNCWQILAISGPKPRHRLDSTSVRYFQTDNEQISIAARKSESNRKELVAIFGENVIEVKPRKHKKSNYIVQVNNKQVKLSEKSEHILTDDEDNVILKIGLSPNGFIKIEGPRSGMRIIYDESRVELYASNRLRNRIRGICGNFDGEDSNDFMTTDRCILKDPLHFVTNYTLHQNCSDPRVKEMSDKVSKIQCTTETDKMSRAVYDEYGNKLSLMYDINRNREKHDQTRSCKSHIVRIVEPQGKACFSIRPRLRCRSHCKATREIEETVDFHCFENNLVGKQWIEMVKKGGNPGPKDANYREKIKYPEDCVPK